MEFDVATYPGDGIGVDVTHVAKRALEAAKNHVRAPEQFARLAPSANLHKT